jgi:alpha-galactosidase
MALAATPYMGWNSYYGIGGAYDERTIREVADALVARGLARAGYTIVWLDYGWASGARDADGELVIDAAQWPHGLRGLTDSLHDAGLLAGIYTDAGRSGCDGRGVGSLGHYQRDADCFAAWGFDAVKVDFCGAGQERLDPVPAYTDFIRALRGNASGRPLIVNVCNFWRPGHVGGGYPPYERSAHAVYRWAPAIAESWRTDTDIGFTHDVVFPNVMRNLDANAAHPEAAGPGHWNDPDYLAPELGMTDVEARTQLTMWAVVAAPLVIGSDVRALCDDTVAMLVNPGVIAIDQDPLGVQGRPIRRWRRGQVWAKPLADGSAAVALLNRTGAPARISTTARKVGLPKAAEYELRDVWDGSERRTRGAIDGVVDAHGTALYRATPA